MAPRYVLEGFKKSSELLIDSLGFIYDRFGDKLRKIALPWSAVFPKGHKYYLKRKVERFPLLRPGVQMVRSKVGGGKSLTSFVLATMTLEKTGHPSYMTSAVEKPKLSEDGSYWYVFHPVVDLDTYFHSGKQHKRFNTKKMKNIHKDENHLRYNPRMNKTKEYNEKYIPEHKHELIMRHDGFDTIYKYSQHLRLDGQDMETIDMMHEVETIKDIPLSQWLKDGKYKYVPVKLKFTSYFLIADFDGTIRRELYKEWELPIPASVLADYDTYAERHLMDGLPYDIK